MKKILLSFLTLGLSSVNGQVVVNDSVSVNVGYANQSFYSLSNGEVSNTSNTNWDLAFDVSAFGSVIRTNGGTGTELYAYPYGDISYWTADIDTTGMSGWPILYNSDTSWYIGAFDKTMTSDPTDLGWGVYNTITHQVVGDSLYVIKLSNGQYKKLQITSLASGAYTFKYGNFDGSEEVTATIAKSSYNTKNFVYYSMQSGTVIDREPVSSTWDIAFGKYVAELFPGTYYGVTGVLQNVGVRAAKAYPLNNVTIYEDYASHSLETNISKIGHDWKYFDLNTFSYLMEDSTCYFIKDQSNDIWKIVFSYFGGSSNGDVHFSKEKLSEGASSITDLNGSFTSLTLYPNPVKEKVNILFDSPSIQNQLEVYDLNGRLVYATPVDQVGFINFSLNVTFLDAGIYNVMLKNPQGVVSQKLIVQ